MKKLKKFIVGLILFLLNIIAQYNSIPNKLENRSNGIHEIALSNSTNPTYENDLSLLAIK